MWADRQKFGGDTHTFLPLHHLPDHILIVKGLLAAGLGALKQPVVALCVEKRPYNG